MAEHGFATIGSLFMLLAVVAGGSMFGYAATHQGTIATSQLDAVAVDAVERADDVVITTGPVYVQDVNGDGAIDAADSVTMGVSAAPGTPAVDLEKTSAILTTPDGRYPIALNPTPAGEMTFAPPTTLAPNEQFTIELTLNGGPKTSVTNTIPSVIDGVMTLYY